MTATGSDGQQEREDVRYWLRLLWNAAWVGVVWGAILGLIAVGLVLFVVAMVRS